MDQGFGPKLSRMAAGVCFLLFLGVLQYFFGRWVMYGVLFFPVLLALLLLATLPKSSRKKRIINLVSNSGRWKLFHGAAG
jgi:hypothetical protein